MATLGKTFPDIIDMLKASEGNEVPTTVIEMLMQSNPILDDAISVMCNKGDKHLTTVRTGLPSVAWGMLYKGTPQSKSNRQQVEDTTGFLEGSCQVDNRLVERYGDLASAYRMSEALGFTEAMNQEMATGMFYHDVVATPERFKGLAPRYSAYALNSDTAKDSTRQVVHGGGVGSDNTSIWMVTWGEMDTHLIYPKNTPAGIEREDHGPQRVPDANGDRFTVLEETFRWHMGLSVRDWRNNARIANIDVSDLRGGSVNLYDLLRRAYYRLNVRRTRRPGANVAGQYPAGRTVIYANSTIVEALEAQAINRNTTDNFVRLTPMDVEGKEVLTWKGIPIRECEALLNTEAAIPGV